MDYLDDGEYLIELKPKDAIDVFGEECVLSPSGYSVQPPKFKMALERYYALKEETVEGSKIMIFTLKTSFCPRINTQ